MGRRRSSGAGDRLLAHVAGRRHAGAVRPAPASRKPALPTGSSADVARRHFSGTALCRLDSLPVLHLGGERLGAGVPESGLPGGAGVLVAGGAPGPARGGGHRTGRRGRCADRMGRPYRSGDRPAASAGQRAGARWRAAGQSVSAHRPGRPAAPPGWPTSSRCTWWRR